MGIMVYSLLWVMQDLYQYIINSSTSEGRVSGSDVSSFRV